MNRRRLESLMEAADAAGLSLDTEHEVLWGSKGGYQLMILPMANNENRFSFTFAVSRNGSGPQLSELKELKKQHKAIKGVTVQRYRVNLEVFAGRKTRTETFLELLTLITGTLRRLGYVNCCEADGGETETMACMVGGQYLLLSEAAYADISAAKAEAQFRETVKTENVAGGVVGALLGALIGGVLIVLVGQLGYVSALCGMVLAICTLKGYEKLGGKLTRKGVVIGGVIMLAMIFVAYQCDLAISLAREFDMDFFYCFRQLSSLLFAGGLSGGYFTNLGLMYLFAVIGAVPTVKASLDEKKIQNVTCVLRDAG